ncbi:hypothetical protein CP533_4440 [Ophiocordyceps camponoti-saundersi (nom. inval.)]|nr:hypothetical protein CP533_4440 [Ophiocordyceps camponoti-saundersi (nom. inval.)]
MPPLDGRDGLGFVVNHDNPSNGHEPVTRPDNTDGDVGIETALTSSSRMLPVPVDQHTGWEATNVPTAKCDLCQKQSRGIIQKCSQCKLSVCKTCARDDRLRDDARHSLDPDAVDWKPHPTSSTGRKPRPSKRGGIRKRKAVATAPGRRQLQERDRVPAKARLRPPPSRETSVSFSLVAGHATHSESPVTAVCSDVVGSRQDALDASTTETEEIAAILAGMQRQDRPANDGLHLPPVRSVTDMLQPDRLPPLRTLHPSLGVGRMLEMNGLLLPRPAAMPYGNHHHLSDVRHEAATPNEHGNQPDENTPWNQQQLHSPSYTCSYPPVATEHGLANMTVSLPSTTQGPVWQSDTMSRTPLPSRRPQHHEAIEPISAYEPTLAHTRSMSFTQGTKNRGLNPLTSAVQQHQGGYPQHGQQAAELGQIFQSTTASTLLSNAGRPLTAWATSAFSRIA